jgi:hypothetical protein
MIYVYNVKITNNNFCLGKKGGNIHKYQTYKVASVLPVVNNKIQASIVIQMLR